MKKKFAWSKVYLAVFFVLLYIPIFYLVFYSFNAGGNMNCLLYTSDAADD